MAPTNYTVATTKQYLGAKPPKRVEIDEIWRRRMAASDRANRERSDIKRQANVKTVRFRDDNRDGGIDIDGDNLDAVVEPASTRGEEPARGEDAATSRSGVARNDIHVGGGENVTDVSKYATYAGHVASSASGKVPRVGDVRRSPVVVEFPLRVKELRAEQTLPPRHQDRIQATRLDTRAATASSFPSSNANDSATSSRSGSSGSRHSRRKDSQATEIYFSPVLTTRGSQVFLSDPIEEPQELLTPTQERYDAAREAALQSTSSTVYQRRHRPQSSPEPVSQEKTHPKLMLKPEQVDRLVEALVTSPLLRVHVSKQWWDDVPDDATVVSETTPSLTAGSSFSTIYSHPNQQFTAETRSPSSTQEILEDEFARENPNHPKARKPRRRASSDAFKFGGIAMVDPKVQGSPIRFISKDYRLGKNVLQCGSCSFLNIPYGTSVQSNLRIEPPSSKSVNCRVMLQVVNQVLERKGANKVYLLVAEVDVTESFTRAALMELSAHAKLPLSEIELLAPGLKPQNRDVIDYCALADEVQTSLNITDMVEAAALSFAKLRAETCTMQTLTLMSELERLKTQHQDFLIARPTGHHENGGVARIQLPWISHHLDQLLFETTPGGPRAAPSQAARLLRDRVIVAIAEGCAGEKPFDTRIFWGDFMRSLHCVPLMERLDGKPAAWVAFLSDLERYPGYLAQAYQLSCPDQYEPKPTR